MDKNKNARRDGRAKDWNGRKDRPDEGNGQGPRPPRPDVIKAAIDRAEFYRRELPNVTDWTVKPDGWTRKNFPCVFHEDHNASAGANLKTGAYHCFGCGLDLGSVIDFDMERYGIQSGAAPVATPPSLSKPRAAEPKPTPRPLVPIPPEALARQPKTHPEYGTPSATWICADADGRPLAYLLRFDPAEGRKQFAPLTWNEARGWQWKAPPEPRPLYGLERLAARPKAQALICEGEKAADAAAVLLSDVVAVTTMNGAQAPSKSDFGPLVGRRVLIWPDADAPGAAYAAKVAELARAAGAASVEVLDLESVARDPKIGGARSLPKGWEAADALADGWSPETVAAAVRWVPVSIPQPTMTAPAAPLAPAGEEPPHPFEIKPGGTLYWKPPGAKGGGEDTPPLRICPWLRVIAVTRDQSDSEFGRLVEFRDLDVQTRREVIASREIQGSGDALRARLAAVGFEVSTHPEARRLFLDLLQRWTPEKRARSVTRTGWTDDGRAFVLPGQVIGDGPEPVILATEGERPAFATRGTLDDWRRSIGALCIGNSRLLFAASLVLAPVLLRLADAESGGFHFKGDSTNASSTGKTTVPRVAASGAGAPDYLQRWRTTDNALEGLEELHNDALLILDELNQIEPKAAGESAYMLANGCGKARMDRNASGRPVKRWRVLYLSSGEIGLAEHMASVQRYTRAGQEVRMAEVPADAGAGLGVFEDLHGYADGGAFATALTEAAATCFGTPLPAFVEAVIRNRAALPAIIKRLRGDFVASVLHDIDHPSGQVGRVAARFALVAVAGELATSEGITGWATGAANEATRRCFFDWLKARGGAIPTEQRNLTRQARYFFEQHPNRFRWKSRALDDHAPEVPKQAGFKEEGDGGGIVYYVFPETFANEIVAGYEPKEAARVLAQYGMLEVEGGGHYTKKVRLPGFKDSKRVYVMTADLGEGGDAGGQDGP